MLEQRFKIVEKKRYSLVLPIDIWDELEKVAAENGTTIIELIRRYLKLGLLVSQAEKKHQALLLRDDDKREEIRLLL